MGFTQEGGVPTMRDFLFAVAVLVTVFAFVAFVVV